MIIEHDIDEVPGSPRNPRPVRRFLHAYARLISQPATISTIVRRARDDVDADSSAPSRYVADPYLKALRRMKIVDEVPAREPSVRSSKRLTVTPKRQLGDPSLAASLLQLSPARMLEDLETTGFLFESLVGHELRAYPEAVGASLFHYREHDARLEVDYVLETRDGDWVGVEVKMGESALDKAAASLTRLAARVGRAPKALAVITGGSLAYTRDDGVHVVPLGCLGA